VRKSPRIDWQRGLLLTVTWIVRLDWRLLAAAGVLAIFALVAWPDPNRSAREQNELARLQAQQAEQERRLLAQAQAVPPTGRLNLDFNHLDFFLPPGIQHPSLAGKGFEAYLPTGIKSYDGRDIQIRGFLVPTKVEGGLVREGIIMANQMSCCFGQPPRFCQFVVARFAGSGVPEMMDRPLTFEGKLHVGDVFAEGYWVCLYSLDGCSMSP